MATFDLTWYGFDGFGDDDDFLDWVDFFEDFTEVEVVEMALFEIDEALVDAAWAFLAKAAASLAAATAFAFAVLNEAFDLLWSLL